MQSLQMEMFSTVLGQLTPSLGSHFYGVSKLLTSGTVSHVLTISYDRGT